MCKPIITLSSRVLLLCLGCWVARTTSDGCPLHLIHSPIVMYVLHVELVRFSWAGPHFAHHHFRFFWFYFYVMWLISWKCYLAWFFRDIGQQLGSSNVSFSKIWLRNAKRWILRRRALFLSRIFAWLPWDCDVILLQDAAILGRRIGFKLVDLFNYTLELSGSLFVVMIYPYFLFKLLHIFLIPFEFRWLP